VATAECAEVRAKRTVSCEKPFFDHSKPDLPNVMCIRIIFLRSNFQSWIFFSMVQETDSPIGAQLSGKVPTSGLALLATSALETTLIPFMRKRGDCPHWKRFAPQRARISIRSQVVLGNKFQSNQIVGRTFSCEGVSCELLTHSCPEEASRT
jgi:hypothetical protein